MSDITRKRGDTYPIVFTVSVNGVPADITGCTFLLTVDPSKAPLDNTANICQIVGVITNPTGGIVSFSPSPANVNFVGKYYYDIQITDALGKIRTLVMAKFTLVQDITKA